MQCNATQCNAMHFLFLSLSLSFYILISVSTSSPVHPATSLLMSISMSLFLLAYHSVSCSLNFWLSTFPYVTLYMSIICCYRLAVNTIRHAAKSVFKTKQ